MQGVRLLRETVDVLSEEGNRAILASGLSKLEARLGVAASRDDDEHTAVCGLGPDGGGEGELEAEGRGTVLGPKVTDE